MMEYTELCRRCVDMNALVSWKVHSSTDMVFRILNSIPMHFSEENNTKFEKLFSEIYKNVDLWHETIIRDYVISVIEKIYIRMVTQSNNGKIFLKKPRRNIQ